MGLRLSVPAAVSALEPARLQLNVHLDPIGLSGRDRYRVELLFEEVLMNAVMHAFGPAPGEHRIDVSVEVSEAEVRLHFEDDGVAFDPTTAPVRPAATSLDEDRPAGGLGLPMLRRFSDAMAWRREHARNHLTLTLKRS